MYTTLNNIETEVFCPGAIPQGLVNSTLTFLVAHNDICFKNAVFIQSCQAQKLLKGSENCSHTKISYNDNLLCVHSNLMLIDSFVIKIVVVVARNTPTSVI